jgi:Domain of unknown function (DUF4412)
MLRLIIRAMIRRLCLIACLVAASSAFAQTEFSAEIVDTQKPDNPSKAKIYMAKDKIRIEPVAGNAGGRSTGGMVIMNLATQTSTVLMEPQHMYMEMPAQMASQRNAYNFFRTGDAENACADWLQQAKNKGGTCHKVGSDTVNGRSTVKYEGTNASGDTTTVWLDPKLRFPVKWQGKSSGGELRNIQEGSQPASLFEIPAGYTKMDMGGMMKRPQ